MLRNLEFAHIMPAILTFAFLLLCLGSVAAHYAQRLMPPAGKPTVTAATAVDASEPALTGRSFAVAKDPRGHFQVEARVDGRRMDFMVDTGASVVALRTRDAARLGIHPVPRDFTAEVRTANGTVRAARTRLASVEVGGLIVREVEALVLPDEVLGENLLGMSFLSRLRRFEFTNARLILEQ
jgi:aspartyl protease family protein